MGFWIFMLIMDLLLPFTMIGFGRYFMKKAPKEINSVFGYRTSMSIKKSLFTFVCLMYQQYNDTFHKLRMRLENQVVQIP